MGAYKLADKEIEIIRLGLGAPEKLDLFTGYWFRRRDNSGVFQFDYGFEDQWKWQSKLVFAKQSLIVAICGIGTGKSLGVGMAGLTWAMSTEGFKFMNGANWAYQAKIMWQLIIEQITDTPAEKFLVNVNESPYPKLELEWLVNRRKYRSSLEFMSMDKNAQKIFSWRGDWINLDEAALIDDLDKAMANLSTRLTGKSSRGREYLGRMSLMSNAWDNESSAHMYYFYDLAQDYPEDCLSISIPTSGNRNVTDRQRNQIQTYIQDKDEQARMLEGKRPEGKGVYFNKDRLANCADPYLSEEIESKVEAGDKNYFRTLVKAFGYTEYITPPGPGGFTFLLGDPGSDDYPSRNSPTLGIFDAYDFPNRPARLSAFWWGGGGGKLQPFVDKLYTYKKLYRPIFTGVDSTGPQKGMVEVLNMSSELWDDRPVRRENKTEIIGLDFSGNKKPMYLVSLRNLVEMGLIVWPDMAKGIKMQMLNYDPSKDRYGQPKIAQDIVAMLAMGAHVLRVYYGLDNMQTNDQYSESDSAPGWFTASRDIRTSREERGRRLQKLPSNNEDEEKTLMNL